MTHIEKHEELEDPMSDVTRPIQAIQGQDQKILEEQKPMIR